MAFGEERTEAKSWLVSPETEEGGKERKKGERAHKQTGVIGDKKEERKKESRRH